MPRWLPVLLVACACAGPQGEPQPLELGPMPMFQEQIQPALTERCASGGCHGRPERPLSLYAPGVLRSDSERTYYDEPLSSYELLENAQRLAAFAHGPHERSSVLLCKPLSSALGGCWHGGGDIFEDSTDPLLRSLERWLGARAPFDAGMP